MGDFLRYPRRVLIQALEDGFKEPYFYTDAEDESQRVLNPFQYIKKDGETAIESKLEIADGWSRELDKTNPRPIILCQRDALHFQDASIAGLKDPGIPWGRTKTFNDIIHVPLMFHCFAREDVESEELGLVVGLFFRFFREKHLINTRLHSMGSPTVGPPTPVKTDARADLFDTLVSFPTTMTIGWKLTFGNLRTMTDVGVVARLPNER